MYHLRPLSLDFQIKYFPVAFPVSLTFSFIHEVKCSLMTLYGSLSSIVEFSLKKKSYLM